MRLTRRYRARYCAFYAVEILLSTCVRDWIHSGEMMRQKNRRYTFTVILALILFLGIAVSSTAQVKRVQMHIGGYLCGN